MFSVLRFEIGKALRARMTWAVIALPVAVALLTVWWDSLARKIQTIAGEEKVVTPSAFLGFAKGAGNGFILGGILLLLYSSMIVANEGHWKTFKTIMLRPRSRVAWMTGKMGLLLLLAATMIVAVAAASFVGAAIGSSYTDIVEPGGSYVYYDRAFMVRRSFLALGLALPAMGALAAFGLMFSTFTDHTGIAASATLGAYIMLETAKGQMLDGKLWLFNTFVPSLVDTSYFKALRGFADGMSDTGWADRVYGFSVGAPLAAGAIFFVVACVVFSRRNFLV